MKAFSLRAFSLCRTYHPIAYAGAGGGGGGGVPVAAEAGNNAWWMIGP